MCMSLRKRLVLNPMNKSNANTNDNGRINLGMVSTQLLFLHMNRVSCVVVALVLVVVVGVVVCFRIDRFIRHKCVDSDHCARIRFN